MDNTECVAFATQPVVRNVAEKPDEAGNVRIGARSTASRQCTNVLQGASVPARDNRVVGVVSVLYSRGKLTNFCRHTPKECAAPGASAVFKSKALEKSRIVNGKESIGNDKQYVSPFKAIRWSFPRIAKGTVKVAETERKDPVVQEGSEKNNMATDFGSLR